MSHYADGQLVFIGPGVPHLNVSYGADHQIDEWIVQLRDDFPGPAFLQKPEPAAVRRLFNRARQGLSFGPATKQLVGKQLRQLPGLPPFQRMMTVLQICQQLAEADDVELLHANGTQFESNPREQERINRIYQYVEANCRQPIDVQQVADLTNLTVPAFCRYFKRMTQFTFTDFVNEFRVNQARRLLNSSRTVPTLGSGWGSTTSRLSTKPSKLSPAKHRRPTGRRWRYCKPLLQQRTQ